MLNAVVLWDTRYIDAAVTALRSVGYPVADEDAAWLSPPGDRHINTLGRYAFAPPAGPELRPLRDPASPDNDQ